mgnify:CR=1 FL=1
MSNRRRFIKQIAGALVASALPKREEKVKMYETKSIEKSIPKERMRITSDMKILIDANKL